MRSSVCCGHSRLRAQSNWGHSQDLCIDAQSGHQVVNEVTSRLWAQSVII
jgi:hypothetical protein